MPGKLKKSKDEDEKKKPRQDGDEFDEGTEDAVPNPDELEEEEDDWATASAEDDEY